MAGCDMNLSKVQGMFRLCDNRKISAKEFISLDTLRTRIAFTVDNRSHFIDSNGIDPKFGFPDANWREGTPTNDMFDAYRHLRSGNVNDFDCLRLYCQTFTGYQIMSLNSPSRHLKSVNPIPPDYDDWVDTFADKYDNWVRRWIEMVKNIPFDYINSPPKIAGEIGWNVGGVVVNHDTYSYQERINLLYENGLIEWLSNRQSLKRLRFLEIGAGFGALPRALINIFKGVQYVICDLPESIMFSGLYLKITNPNAKILCCETVDDLEEWDDYDIVLVPNYMFELIYDKEVDFAINTISFSEMSAHQVNTYAKGVTKMIGSDGILFEQNKDETSLGLINSADHLKSHFHKSLELNTNSVFHKDGFPIEGIPIIRTNLKNIDLITHMECFKYPLELG